MIYLRLVWAVFYWILFPRKFFASPLPLWLLTWSLIGGICYATSSSNLPLHPKLFGYSPTLGKPLYAHLTDSLQTAQDSDAVGYVLGMTDEPHGQIDQKTYYQQEIERVSEIMKIQGQVRDGWLYLGWLEANFGSKEKAAEVLSILQQIDPNNLATLQLENWLH